MNKLIVGALAALASASVMGGPAGVTSLAASAPCAPTLDPKHRISPPSGLRILRGLLRLDSPVLTGTTQEEETQQSGPYVAPESTTTAITNPDSHAYFDSLSVRGDCMVAYSLRDMTQLLYFMDQPNPDVKPWDITYDPLHDPDPRRQDAAKIVVPANEPSLPNNVRLPIPSVGSDSLFVTWDAWLGREFAYEFTGIGNYKQFQFTSPDRIWTEVKSDFDQAAKEAPGAVSMVLVRAYANLDSGLLGPNVTNDQPLSPMTSQFAVMPERWTRYWAFFNPVGGWFEFSLWLADGTRGPVLVLDRLQIKPNYPNGATGWENFWLEYNTSSHGWDSGFPARVSYARNVVMMRGTSAAQIPALLQRPVD